MLIVAKIVQGLGLSFLAFSFVLTLPEPLRGRDVAIGAAIFMAGWLMQRLKR